MKFRLIFSTAFLALLDTALFPARLQSATAAPLANCAEAKQLAAAVPGTVDVPPPASCEPPCTLSRIGCSCPNPTPLPTPTPEPPTTVTNTPGASGGYTSISYESIFGTGIHPQFLTYDRGNVPACLQQRIDAAYQIAFGITHVDSDSEFIRRVLGPYNLAGVAQVNVYSGRIVIDSNCNRVPEDTPAENAISIRVICSPISLLWEAGTEVDRDFRLVRFPLNLSKGAEWVEWKASKGAPLLVYDPLRKRHVASAADLFGNWSFADITSAPDPSRAEAPWKHGYEALATLDLNGDGAIRGAELDPVALWFDEDRDGVSGTGEVVGAAEKGVTALYYKPDRVDEDTHAIYATKGFERESGGVRITGTSVDWFAPSAGSPLTLLQHLRSSPIGKAAGDTAISRAAALLRGNRVQESKKQAAVQLKRSQQFGGAWRWRVSANDDDSQPQGFLLLSDKNGEIRGASVVEMLIPGSGGLRIIEAYPIAGRSFTERSGRRRAVFSVLEPNGVSTTEVTLVAGGSEITGTTTLKDVSYLGKTVSLDYDWKAERIRAPKPKRQAMPESRR